jgi:hypothetical protein
MNRQESVHIRPGRAASAKIGFPGTSRTIPKPLNTFQELDIATAASRAYYRKKNLKQHAK